MTTYASISICTESGLRWGDPNRDVIRLEVRAGGAGSTPTAVVCLGKGVARNPKNLNEITPTEEQLRVGYALAAQILTALSTLPAGQSEPEHT